MKNKQLTGRKLNNKGFSLVELLVAVVILAIVVPVALHAFVSSANTNAKSNETLIATTLCEDVMEELDSLTVKEASLKYGGNEVDGVYSWTILGDRFDPNASSYEISCVLSPGADGSKYDTWNKKNVTDIQAITSERSGVYAMLPTEDNSAYNFFKDNHPAGDSSYANLSLDWFKENVTRNITMVVSSNGNISVTNEDGSVGNVRHVKAMITVEYFCPATFGGKKVADSTTYKPDIYPKEVYNNLNSHAKFDGVYIIYTPTYHSELHPSVATGSVNENMDYIYIQNDDNVEGRVYVIRENTPQDAGIPGLSNYKARIELRENMAWATGGIQTAVDSDSNARAALKLYTNLYNTEASNIQSANKYFNLKYTHKLASVTPVTDLDTCLKAMQVRSADGRTFDGSAANTRIYEVSITVKKDSQTVASMTGTKIQ